MEPKTVPPAPVSWFTMTMKAIKEVGFPIVAAVALFYFMFFKQQAVEDAVAQVQGSQETIRGQNIQILETQRLYNQQILDEVRKQTLLQEKMCKNQAKTVQAVKDCDKIVTE